MAVGAFSAVMLDSALYQRLLGAEWQQLKQSGGCTLLGRASTRPAFSGSFMGAIARPALLGLPAEAENVEVRLQVTPSGPAELWSRTFARRRFLTRQSATA